MSLGRFIWFVLTALSLALVYVFLATPVHTRSAANEASAVGTARSFNTLNQSFKDKNRRYAANPAELEASLSALMPDSSESSRRLVRYRLKNHDYSGYMYRYTLVDRGMGEFGYFVRLSPSRPGESGKRYFYIDETGVIRYSEKPDVGAHSPALQ